MADIKEIVFRRLLEVGDEGLSATELRESIQWDRRTPASTTIRMAVAELVQMGRCEVEHMHGNRSIYRPITEEMRVERDRAAGERHMVRMLRDSAVDILKNADIEAAAIEFTHDGIRIAGAVRGRGG